MGARWDFAMAHWGGIYEVMDGPHMAKSTAHAEVNLTLDAILDCKRLRVKLPHTKEELDEAALGFRCRSSQEVIRHCVSAADGLFVRRLKPTNKEHVAPERFFSSHKKAVGMNAQAMCTSRFVFTAVSCMTSGSTNDRQAWVVAGFDELIAKLPDPYYVLGDAAYGATEKMLVPYPGANLDVSRETCNYYQSQSRMSIEQAFGILVKTWGILRRPLEVPLNRTAAVIHTTVRLHNFLRKRRAAVMVPKSGPARDENAILQNDIWRTAPGGRPVSTQSVLRETVRREVAMRTLVRPIHNVQRNKSWRNQPQAEDTDEASSP